MRVLYRFSWYALTHFHKTNPKNDHHSDPLGTEPPILEATYRKWGPCRYKKPSPTECNQQGDDAEEVKKSSKPPALDAKETMFHDQTTDSFQNNVKVPKLRRKKYNTTRDCKRIGAGVLWQRTVSMK